LSTWLLDEAECLHTNTKLQKLYNLKSRESKKNLDIFLTKKIFCSFSNQIMFFLSLNEIYLQSILTCLAPIFICPSLKCGKFHVIYVLNGVAVAEWSKTHGWEPRCKVVSSIPNHAANFSILNWKKIYLLPSVRVIVVCSGQRIILRDSYKGLGRALKADESLLHQIIIIIISNSHLIQRLKMKNFFGNTNKMIASLFVVKSPL